MKKLNLLIFVLTGLLVFASCEDSLGPKFSTNVEPTKITTGPSGESIVLTEENADETAFEIEWSKPGVGFRTAADYKVEMAPSGTDFESPTDLGQTSETSFSMTVGEFNNSLLAAGLPANVESEIEVRVITDINDDIEQMLSDPISMSVTPYFIDVSYPQIFVPGSYQSASGYGNDWTPQDAPPLTSVESNEQYEGYVYMANGGNQYKFTPERDWDADYGDSGGDGSLEAGGNNIELADPGYYKINVNLNTLTYTVLNTQWGVIGSATPNGWDSDQDMSYDLVDKVWTITLNLSAGEMKFRANDAWDLDYGDNEGDGILDQGGSNIQVAESGNYTVTLDLSEAPYSYSLSQN
ncbi:SusE domain-containing protein [Gracilimonas sp.]|uniref:SusE domain-containing protein n=1 Tax=Gracilimonas sp. TaxID=1974203 RepID=UPI0028726338|nr:SusE domain-containing protein [Gracilimonas sp.]